MHHNIDNDNSSVPLDFELQKFDTKSTLIVGVMVGAIIGLIAEASPLLIICSGIFVAIVFLVSLRFLGWCYTRWRQKLEEMKG